MSREEFQQFIDSFGKKPGEYTRDELLEIGRKHKELDIRDKSWSTLCKVVGWQGSADSYRSFVNRLTKEEIREPLTETSELNYEEALRRLYIEKTKIRDINNDYRKNMREEARIEALREDLQKAIKELWPLPQVKPGKISANYNQTEAIVTFADLHIGPDIKNSYNEYNLEIATRRVQKWVDDTINYCKKNNVKTLHVLNLGDLIMGLIHPTLRIQQSLDVTQQIIQAAELLSEALNQLQAAAPEITYRSVVDNHSRAVADKHEHIEKENFQNLIDWFVEERLRNTDIKIMKDNIDVGIGKFRLGNGKLVMFAHGHNDPRNNVVQNMIALTRELPDYIFLAHFHNSAEKTFQGFKVIITGSIIGVDDYAYNKRLFSHAEQKLVIFDEDNFLNITLDLQNA